MATRRVLRPRVHAGGWFRHWFDVSDGGDPRETGFNDGFSTIDTALLVAGAILADNYFSANHLAGAKEFAVLARELLDSIDWPSAVHDPRRGSLYTTFDRTTDRPRGITDMFNEYALVACLGAHAEAFRGKPGVFTEFWNTHLRDPSNLPKRAYHARNLLTDTPNHALSSFALPFAACLCGDIASSPIYKRYMIEAREADREFARGFGGAPYFWGMGTGEVVARERGRMRSSYHADAIDNNPHQIISPSIIAGFLSVDPSGLGDLLSLRADGRCLYRYGGLQILWRCSATDANARIERVQAVDFALMPLGLATLDPRVTFDFYRQFAPRTAPTATAER